MTGGVIYAWESIMPLTPAYPEILIHREENYKSKIFSDCMHHWTEKNRNHIRKK